MQAQTNVLEQGMKALGAANASEALDYFEQAISLKVDVTSAQYWKANALMQLNRKSEALKTLDILLSIDPKHKKAFLLKEQLQSKSALPAAGINRVQELMLKAQTLMISNQFREALNYLNEAKSYRFPTQDLDALRASCFWRLADEGSTRQALYEELRYFPKNPKAREMLHELDALRGEATGRFQDMEFQNILKIIRPFTMLSEARLYSLFSLAKAVCEKNIPGNFVECGVAAGGSSALLGYVISKYSKIPRFLYSFDSFEGMPKPGKNDTHAGLDAESTGWGTGTCSAPEESVKEACKKAGVTARVVLVKGYFEQTLPKVKDFVGMIAFLHMDGDWYESTKAIFENTYDHLVDNSCIQIDDYGFWEGCSKAVHEFEKKRGIQFALKPIDGTGVWCVKPERFPINTTIPKSLIVDFQQDDPAKAGIQSQMSPNERFQVYYAIRELLKNKTGSIRTVEVGSFAGASLFLANRALKRLGVSLEMFAVEPDPQSQFHQVVQALSGEVKHLSLFSSPASLQLKEVFANDGTYPDFIFIDGDHTYEGVKEDILNYYPLLASGGMIMFHDYLPPLDGHNRDAILFHHGNKEPGIRQACEEVMEKKWGCKPLDLPLLFPTDPTQTQSHLPLIPGVKSTVRAYQKV